MESILFGLLRSNGTCHRRYLVLYLRYHFTTLLSDTIAGTLYLDHASPNYIDCVKFSIQWDYRSKLYLITRNHISLDQNENVYLSFVAN